MAPSGSTRDLDGTSLAPASAADAALLSNLLELYAHDLSGVFPHLQLGADGRFGYPKLPLYWSEPERRFAFLIRSAGRVAGFVLASRGSPAVEDPDVLDVAEFFVLRGYRRAGVGRQAAFLLWSRLPGKWIVRVSEGNATGLAFWKDIVREFTHGTGTEFRRPGEPQAWRVFCFESHLRP